MPEGIIRDPKQNPFEKEFGIIYIPDLNMNVKYFKSKGSTSRGLIAGVIASVNESSIHYYPNEQIIDGISVAGYTNQKLDYDENLNKRKAPAIHAFMGELKGYTGVRKIIENLISSNTIGSDVPPD